MEEEPIKTYSFKAGIMNFNDDTKLVSADKRKGIVTASKVLNTNLNIFIHYYYNNNIFIITNFNYIC